MAFSFDDFNPEENPEQGGFEPIPGGTYPVMVTEAFMEKFSEGRGEAYRLKLQILNGPCQNRILFVFMGVAHADEHSKPGMAMMVKIAKGMVTGLGKALGVQKIPSATFPVGRQLQVKVSCKKSKKTGELENNVDRFLPMNAVQQQPTPQVAATPAMAGNQVQNVSQQPPPAYVPPAASPFGQGGNDVPF